MTQATQSPREYWRSLVASALTTACMIATVFLGFGDVLLLSILGVVLLAAAAAFWGLAVLTFRRGGGKEREHFSEPTELITTGVYAIVRHPQYLAWVLFAVSPALVTQHWAVAVAGAAALGLFLHDFTMVEADEGVARFGEAYRTYAERVPGWNPIAGVWRLLQKRSP